MARHKGYDSEEVRRAYLRAGADMRAAGRLLGVTDSTVKYHLGQLAGRPLIVPAVSVQVPPGTSDDDQQAIAQYVRLMLERAGILREAPEPDEAT